MAGREARHEQGPRGYDGRGLTPTEKEVLQAAMYTESRQALARALGMSPNTEKAHLREIFIKLRASNIVEAIWRGIEGGHVECYCTQAPGPLEVSPKRANPKR